MRARAKLVFGLDTRSLAVARISLGLIVVLDVLNRVSDYRFFYTEAGALPRLALLQYLQRRDHISLFMASGSDWWAGACFAIEAAAAICFLEGHDALVLAAPRQVALVVPYELAGTAALADPIHNSLGVAVISFGGADEREARHAL